MQPCPWCRHVPSRSTGSGPGCLDEQHICVEGIACYRWSRDIELAADHGFPLEQRAVPAEEVRRADEVFVTSTAGGIMPVTEVDGRPVGNGAPGPITLRLREAYWGLHNDPRFATAVRYD
jgi:hypothetical protein